MKSKGFTLIELIVVLFLASFFILTIFYGIRMISTEQTPVVCYGGVKFLEYPNMEKQQIIGPNGGGIPCDGTEAR